MFIDMLALRLCCFRPNALHNVAVAAHMGAFALGSTLQRVAFQKFVMQYILFARFLTQILGYTCFKCLRIAIIEYEYYVLVMATSSTVITAFY